MGRPSSFVPPLHQPGSSVAFQDCPFPCLGLDLDPRPRFCTSTGFRPPSSTPYPRLSPLPHCCPHSANPLSFISNFRLVRSKPKPTNGPLSARATFFGGSARARQPLQARRRLPRYWNPTELIYPSLCQGQQAHDPTSPCFNAHSEQRPKINRTHCRQSQPPDAEAHSSPTTPRQPGRLTLPLPLALTSQAQPAVHSSAREISLAQAASSGAPGTGSSEPLPPNDCCLAGD